MRRAALFLPPLQNFFLLGAENDYGIFTSISPQKRKQQLTSTRIVYYYIYTLNKGQKNAAQLLPRKIEISASREKHAPTRPCGASQGVKIHHIGLGSGQKSTELRHFDWIEHLLRRIGWLPHRKKKLLKSKALDECFFVALYTMLPRQFADNRIYDISREIKRIKKRGRHHSKDVGASNRHNLRLHRVLGTRQKRAVHNWNHRPSEIFWRNDRLFARHCRLILKKALNECFFVAYFFGASRVWHSYSRTQPYYLQWPRYLDEEQGRHGLKQNPMYI